MRRSKSQTNMNTVVGLVAAILVVNVLIFFVVTRDKDKNSSEDRATLTAQDAPKHNNTAAGGTFPSLEEMQASDPSDENERIEKPEPLAPAENEPLAPAENESKEIVLEETVETEERASARETANPHRDKRSRARNKGARAKVTTAKVEQIVTPPVKTIVEPQKTKTYITTIPSGATISLDGIFIGKSPIVGLPLATGNHSVAVSYNGYKPQVARLKVGHGGVEKLKIRLEKNTNTTVPVTTAKAPTLVVKSVTRSARTPRVGKSTLGNATRGRSVLGGTCNSCHTSKGVRRINTKKYTSSQWNRFFASGTHDRYERLGGKISSGKLADVKAYVMGKAADAARNQGAGIR